MFQFYSHKRPNKRNATSENKLCCSFNFLGALKWLFGNLTYTLSMLYTVSGKALKMKT